MNNVTPIATRLGFTHVSVAQMSAGAWHALLWTQDDGPTPLVGNGCYDAGVEQAESYAAKRQGVVLDIPSNLRTVDVLRTDGGEILVQEVSMGGGSAAILSSFGPHERESAVAYALRMVPQFAPCKLGRVDL